MLDTKRVSLKNGMMMSVSHVSVIPWERVLTTHDVSEQTDVNTKIHKGISSFDCIRALLQVDLR